VVFGIYLVGQQVDKNVPTSCDSAMTLGKTTFGIMTFRQNVNRQNDIQRVTILSISTLGRTTFGIMALVRMTFRINTFSIMTLGIMAFSTVTLSIKTFHII